MHCLLLKKKDRSYIVCIRRSFFSSFFKVKVFSLNCTRWYQSGTFSIEKQCSPAQPLRLRLQADRTGIRTEGGDGAQRKAVPTHAQRCYRPGCPPAEERWTREGRRGPVWTESPRRGPVGWRASAWPPGFLKTDNLENEWVYFISWLKHVAINYWCYAIF